ncbi:Endonuclease/exonuclease/phosphatase [Mycena metata]|uniref:Endonuclease/exonuclease/phosphatase n=1 Tax=Mycena metata TaxID=1033252 RepID=A0AAD7NJQ2_9AGAR|nr:Endonuclease/exonuclease/phosphatase [Mycena metata]
MRGRFHQGQDKWLYINQIMRSRRIGVLGLQETHLSPGEVDDIHKIFGKRLQVYASIDPASPQSKGVAFVVNKEISNIEGIETEELIPGRALRISIPWHGESRVTGVVAYAPNDPTENARFLDILETKLRRRKPDFVLGDFNMVEDAIDRMPHHKDANVVTEAMLEFKSKLHLIDGWRRAFPDLKSYTFLHAATGSQSRIDRVLLTENMMKYTYDWTIESPGIHTDHQLLSMKYSDPNLPFIGKGRWVLPLRLLKDKKVMEQVYALGKEMEARLEGLGDNRSDEDNPQKIWKSFKDEITELFRERDKVMVPKMEKDIKSLKEKMNKTLNNPLIGEEERRTEESPLHEDPRQHSREK